MKPINETQNMTKRDLKSEMLQTTEISPRESEMIERLKAGETVVINMKTDKFVMDWAIKINRFARIDRNTVWGNPFIINEDGNRDTVCNSFEFHYLPNKPGLMKKVDTLKGKALGCWCAPLNCHGNSLKRIVDNS
jgi:hypothetical protein